MLRSHVDLATAGGDEAILERVGNLDGWFDADDAGGTLERVGGAHHRLDRLRRQFEAFDGQDPGRQHGRLGVGLEPEQFEHGESAQIVRHGMLLPVPAR